MDGLTRSDGRPKAENAVSGVPRVLESPTTPSEPIAPTYVEDSSPVGREIWLTDAVLLSELSPHAKLLVAHVAPWRKTSYDDLTHVLPFGRDALAEAIREAVQASWLTVKSGRDTKHPAAKLYPLNRYETSALADPRSKAHPGYFTRLPVTTDLGASAGLWILRAVYLREQFRTGAIRLPDSIAATLSGLTKQAVKDARSKWLRSGLLVRVALPTVERRLPTLILTRGPYQSDLARFNPDHRTRVKIGGVRAWASAKQAAFLLAREDQVPLEWARQREQPILAEDLIHAMGGAVPA